MKVFGRFWIDVLGRPGGRGEDFIADISRHLHHLTRATPEGCGGSKKSSKIDAKTFKKHSKKRCEKRVEKQRPFGGFSRFPGGDPGPTNTYKSTRHIRPLKTDTYRERQTSTL